MTESCAASSGANGKSLPKTTWSQPTSSANDESACTFADGAATLRTIGRIAEGAGHVDNRHLDPWELRIMDLAEGVQVTGPPPRTAGLKGSSSRSGKGSNIVICLGCEVPMKYCL